MSSKNFGLIQFAPAPVSRTIYVLFLLKEAIKTIGLPIVSKTDEKAQILIKGSLREIFIIFNIFSFSLLTSSTARPAEAEVRRLTADLASFPKSKPFVLSSH